MAENVLEKIIKKKSEKIVNLKKTISLDSLNELIDTNKTFIDFKEKIKNNTKNDKFSIVAVAFLDDFLFLMSEGDKSICATCFLYFLNSFFHAVINSI